MSLLEFESHPTHTLIAMNRAEVHNAFDAQLIEALTQAVDRLSRDRSVRAIVLTGRGTSFSAGADLNWMRSQLGATEQQNLNDARQLAQLMRTLAFCGKPTIARVNGQAFGGGVGLIACCDIAIGVTGSKFGLTEAKLGLAPAVISPYVIEAIGLRASLRYFQTAELFDAERAAQLGLLHDVVSAEALDAAIEKQLKLLSNSGPVAVQACKSLAHRVAGRSVEQQMLLDEENAHLIAKLRVSPEGQEGLSAFLEKRKANWVI